ncbi:hypothetical protein [Mycolicibacter minnesotensis]
MTAPEQVRYGPYGFAAAVATMTLVQTATWAWFPYLFFSVYFFGAATVVLLPIGFFMSLMSGKAVQIGRGIMIGYLATPLTIAITVIPTVLVLLVLHLA